MINEDRSLKPWLYAFGVGLFTSFLTGIMINHCLEDRDGWDVLKPHEELLDYTVDALMGIACGTFAYAVATLDRHWARVPELDSESPEVTMTDILVLA